MDFSKYSGIERIHIDSELLSKMHEDKLIHSKNVTGDLGEYIGIDYYIKQRACQNCNLLRHQQETLMLLETQQREVQDCSQISVCA